MNGIVPPGSVGQPPENPPVNNPDVARVPQAMGMPSVCPGESIKQFLNDYYDEQTVGAYQLGLELEGSR